MVRLKSHNEIMDVPYDTTTLVVDYLENIIIGFITGGKIIHFGEYSKIECIEYEMNRLEEFVRSLNESSYNPHPAYFYFNTDDEVLKIIENQNKDDISL